MKHLRFLFTLMVCAVIGGTIIAAGGQVSERQALKSRHYYYEALRQETAGNSSAAYELFRHAYNLNPDNAEAAGSYGLYRLLTDLDTLQSRTELNRSLELMRQRVDQFPGDYYEAEQYAYIAKLLDTIPETVRVLRRVIELNPERTSVLLNLAQSYAQMEDFPNAIAALDSFESREGADIEVAVNRMSMKLALKDTVGVIADVDRLIAQHPGNIEYIILKGEIYDFIQKPDSTLSMYLLAEQMDSTAYQPKYALAEAYRSRGDSVNYDRKTYEVLLNNDLEMERKVEILAEYLQMLISNKQDTSRGDYLFEVLTKQYPYEAEVLDLSARYNAAKGNPQLAIENINYALDQNRSNKNYWGQLMTYQMQAERPADAMASYREAKKNTEPDRGLDILYAAAAQMNKDYDTVVNVYTNIIHEIVPNVNVNDTVNLEQYRSLSYEGINIVSNAYTSIGDALYQKGDTTGGFRAYENALALLPDNSLALNNYAYFLGLAGKDLERALTMSETSVQIDPDNPTNMDTYAWLLFLTHDYPKALQYQAAAVELAEKEGSLSAELYAHYGDILFMNGKPEEAVKYWKKALEINKDGDLSEKEVKLLRKKVDHKTFFYE